MPNPDTAGKIATKALINVHHRFFTDLHGIAKIFSYQIVLIFCVLLCLFAVKLFFSWILKNLL